MFIYVVLVWLAVSLVGFGVVGFVCISTYCLLCAFVVDLWFMLVWFGLLISWWYDVCLDGFVIDCFNECGVAECVNCVYCCFSEFVFACLVCGVLGLVVLSIVVWLILRGVLIARFVVLLVC